MNAVIELKDHSEAAVITALLNHEIEIEYIKSIVAPEDFSNPFLRACFEKIIDESDKGKRLDFVGAVQKFPDHREYLRMLSREMVSVNVIEHAKKILEQKTIQTYRATLLEEVKKIDSVEEIEASCARFFNFNTSNLVDTGIDLRTLAVEMVEKIDEMKSTAYLQRVIHYPIPELQKVTGGLQPGQLVVIAARPSIGKSALAMQICWVAAKRGRRSVAVHLEMSELDVIKRSIAYETDTPIYRIKHDAKQKFFEKVMQMPGDIISDFVSHNIRSIEAMITNAVRKQRCSFAMIDYLQLIGGNSKLPKHEAIAEITRTLKLLAKRLGIPIIILAQVNRSAEGETPGLNHLKDSGSIEQDADVVIFLHADRNQEGVERDVEIIVAKNRNGPCGKLTHNIRHVYHGPTFKFSERPEFKSVGAVNQ